MTYRFAAAESPFCQRAFPQSRRSPSVVRGGLYTLDQVVVRIP